MIGIYSNFGCSFHFHSDVNIRIRFIISLKLFHTFNFTKFLYEFREIKFTKFLYVFLLCAVYYTWTMVNPGLKFGPYEETSNWRFFLSSAEASLPHKIFAMIFLKKVLNYEIFKKINIYNSHSRCYLAECVTNSSHSKKKTSLKPDFLIHDNGEEAKIWGVNTLKNLDNKRK